MHSFIDKHSNNHALFNSDFSGDVELTNANGESLKISGEFLLELVAHYVRGELISNIERAEAKGILVRGFK